MYQLIFIFQWICYFSIFHHIVATKGIGKWTWTACMICKGRNIWIEWLKKSKILPIFDLDCDCKSFLSDWGIGALGFDCQSNPSFLWQICRTIKEIETIYPISRYRIAASDWQNGNFLNVCVGFADQKNFSVTPSHLGQHILDWN